MILHLYGLSYELGYEYLNGFDNFFYNVIIYSFWREMRLHAIVFIANSVENVLIEIIIQSGTVKSMSNFVHLYFEMILW